MRRSWVLLLGGVTTTVLMLGLRGDAAAQELPSPGSDPEEGDEAPFIPALQEARIEGERAHLRRVGIWGGANLLAGTALAMTTDDDREWVGAFGWQSAGWGAVNGAIALVGLLRSSDPDPSSAAEAQAAEDRLAHILLVNLGLNVGYMGVGTTMMMLAGDEPPTSGRIRGHGGAVVLQGLGLFALDLMAYLESRERLAGYRELLDRVEVQPDIGGGAGISIRIR
jgi:hypothetical protein